MKQRGRKGKAATDLATISAATTMVDAETRPDAPYDLSDEQADIWRAVVATMPATWFNASTYPLLVQYCRHITNARRLAQLIDAVLSGEQVPGADAADGDDAVLNLKGYAALLRAQKNESTAIALLATKMRLAQQSTIERDAKKAKVGMKRPWQA